MISRGPLLPQLRQCNCRAPSPEMSSLWEQGSKPPLVGPAGDALLSSRSLRLRVEKLMSCPCTLPVPFFCGSLGPLNILFNLDLLIHYLVFPNGLAFQWLI